MIKGFLAYDLAFELYQQCETVETKGYIKDQLSRAALSIVLNLAEGSGKPSIKEKRRFYAISLGSMRETQAILQVLGNQRMIGLAHRLGGMIYRLVHPR